MIQYGKKKHTGNKLPGHGFCAHCMPEIKNAKKKARREGRKESSP